ncbi:hypothetical protein JGUZn3_12490 [Entomobacter blattae]|uniref:Uncharacterized protein n=1 Tax=Entomobacter blattae TaxID=2762277 RepID=A0A7H1NRR5_9PROT|nr:hypothetical protein JGUZn3_12490 [Entomobacter blattae]
MVKAFVIILICGIVFTELYLCNMMGSFHLPQYNSTGFTSHFSHSLFLGR